MSQMIKSERARKSSIVQADVVNFNAEQKDTQLKVLEPFRRIKNFISSGKSIN